jgi:uncharacterized protein YmfQ (DUF2313 family)
MSTVVNQLGTDIERDVERDLFDYMPKEYEEFLESQAIVGAQAVELAKLYRSMSDILSQFYVDTATWGLAEWEKLTGLPVAPDYSNWDALPRYNVAFSTVEGTTWDEFEKEFVPDLNERRSAVVSKLRGHGTLSKSKLAEICGAYTGGDVTVHEYPSEFRIVIEFTGEAGVPANMDTLQSVLAELIPAHLSVEYTYRYLRWNELDGYAWSWDVLDSNEYTWDEFSEAVL